MNIKTKKTLSLLIGMIFLLVTPAHAAEIGTIHDTPTKKDNNNIQPIYTPQKSTHTQINSPLENSNITKNKTNNNTKNTITDNPTLNELNFNLKETQNDCIKLYESTAEILDYVDAEIKNLTQNQTKLKEERQKVISNNSRIYDKLKTFNTQNLTTEQEKNKTLIDEQYKKSSKLLETIENKLERNDKKIKSLEKNEELLSEAKDELNKTINAKTKASALKSMTKIDYDMKTMNLAESQINSLNEIVAKYISNQNNNTINNTNKTNKINSTKAATLGSETGTAVLLNTYTTIIMIVWKTKNIYATRSASTRISAARNLININENILKVNLEAVNVHELLKKASIDYADVYEKAFIRKEHCENIVSDMEKFHIKNIVIKDKYSKMETSYSYLMEWADCKRVSPWIADRKEWEEALKYFTGDEFIDKVVRPIAKETREINVKYLKIAEKEGFKLTEGTTLERFIQMAEDAGKQVIRKNNRVLGVISGVSAVVSVVFDIYFAVSIGSLAGYELGLWEKDYVNDFVDELCSDTFNYLTS